MYNEKQRQDILERLQDLQENYGHSRRSGCKELGIAESTVRGWEKAIIEVEEDKPKYIVTKSNKVQWTYSKGKMEVELSTVDNAFYQYSKHGLNKSATQVQNSLRFNPIQWQSFKRTFDLVKDSDVFSPYSLSLVSGKDKTDMIASKIAEKYSDDNMRDVIAYESDKQKNRAYQKAIKKAQGLDYRRSEFETEILDYITKAQSKVIVKKVKAKSKRHGVHTFADPHAGAKVEATYNLPAYNTDILRDRLNQIATKINAENNAKNTICINGDLIETFTGLNHMNSWKGIDNKYGYGVKATILVTDLLTEFFSKVENIHEVLIVAGNHDRTTSSNQEDVDGEVIQWVHYVLQAKFGHLFNLEHSPDVMVRAIDNVCYIWTHGHLSISKRSPAEIINIYGIPGMYCIVIEGHLHTRKIKFDSATGRVIVISSLFTGNTFSKNLGYSTLPGFVTMYSDGKYPIVIDIPLI
jgi:metallophosphoesterase superfamily enzyme